MHAEMDGAFAEVEPLLVNKDLAPLLWYLTEVFQLTVEEAQDAICDSNGDKGIDALLVDDEDETIYVFQSKRRNKTGTHTGDVELKKLDGTLTQLMTPAGVQKLEETASREVAKLLEQNEICTLVEEGYSLRGVLVTNAVNNKDSTDIIELAAAANRQLESVDLVRLHRAHMYAKAPGFVDVEASLRIHFTNSLCHDIQAGVKMYVCLVSALDIVSLSGIDDESLFAHNVRLHLGNTRINKAIQKTVTTEPAVGFPAFHNGLTLVTRSADRAKNSSRIRIRGYSVVNGCQSIKTLAANRTSLPDDLQVLVKLVIVDPSVGEAEAQELIRKITTRSNNQNSINMQDLRSGDKKQRALKAEFKNSFGGAYEYVIMRGETVPADAEALHNDLCAQCLISLYDERPHLAHRKFSLFDSEYHRVFDRKVHAGQVLLSYMVFQAVSGHLSVLQLEAAEVYRLTRFVLVNAVGAILRESRDGKLLIDIPLDYLLDPSKRQAVAGSLDDIAYEAAVGLWSYLADQKLNDPSFDFKSAFKSAKGVKAVANEAVKAYKLSTKKNGSSFTLPT